MTELFAIFHLSHSLDQTGEQKNIWTTTSYFAVNGYVEDCLERCFVMNEVNVKLFLQNKKLIGRVCQKESWPLWGFVYDYISIVKRLVM